MYIKSSERQKNGVSYERRFQRGPTIYVLSRNMKTIIHFLSQKFPVLVVKFLVDLIRRVFCNGSADMQTDLSRSWAHITEGTLSHAAAQSKPFCILVTGIDLGNTCSTTPECTAGNGGAGSICSTNCVCDSNNNYVSNGGTCKKGKLFRFNWVIHTE